MVLDESAQKVLSELRRSRGVVKASLTRVRKFVDNFNPLEQALSLLEFRQEELPRICKKFEDIQAQLELITEDAEKEEEERDCFESEYFDLRSRIQEIINAARPQSSTALNASFRTIGGNRPNLAPIALPIFNGDIKDWESFYDIYRVMVHDEDIYSPAQKFMYLRSCLKGPASELVQSIPISDNNYKVVIERLKQRYDNRSLVIQAHIRELLNSPTIEVPSAKALQALHAHVCTHVAALKALHQPVEQWDAWLVTIITSCMDGATAHDWELRRINNDLPKFEDLERFLSSRGNAFENSEACMRKSIIIPSSNVASKKSFSTKKSLAVTEGSVRCPQCSGSHQLFRCDKFKAATVSNRLTLVREARLCFNCLAPMHNAEACKSTYKCYVCNQKHHTLLHFERNAYNKNASLLSGTVDREELLPAEDTSAASGAALLASSICHHVFLATALVQVTDRYGGKRECRAVLDNGSQVNFISRKFFKKLQLSSRKAEMPVHGIGGGRIQSSSVLDIHVSSSVKNFSLSIPCYVLPAIVNDLAACPVATDRMELSKELLDDLADPGFAKAGTIDLLIGAGSFYDILEAKRISVGMDTIKLQDSKFGWIVTGGVGATCLLGVGSVGEMLENEWKSLSEKEEGKYGRNSKNNKKCQEEEQARQHFSSTVRRDSRDGRFIVRLPIKGEIEDVGNTINMARARFLNVEQKLGRNETLREEYVKFMREYLEMNHMEEVVDEVTIPERACYLPHHAVVKSSSLTTKVRVVFDASARGTKGQSLNDILLCGPTVQDDVFAILSRFRKHQYVLMADVEKMYRQVKMDPEDCDLQRIVWRFSPSEELRSFRLLTITYGTVPAAFMATQCLVRLAEDAREKYPLASRSIREDFYMDDLMTGHDTEEGCVKLQQEISTILDAAKLPLRKWCSNSQYVRQQIGKCSDDPLFSLEIDNNDTVKSLGLCWKPVADEFRFSITPSIYIRPKLTKRMLLSDLNRVFDPLGFLTPVLIVGKIFLQQLWQIKSDWDCAIADDMRVKWTSFYAGLEELKKLAIPRGVLTAGKKYFEVHGFCDASQEAYGACVYLRSVGQNGIWHSNLLCSKSRVAPLKGATIPRLELSGALCLAELIQKVSESWDIDRRSCRLWTDSMVVLGWINAQSNCLKTYVSNRVNQILELTDASQWNYVNTKDNPADVISRGISARALITSTLWWQGPGWLSMEESAWAPRVQQVLKEQDLPEKRDVRLAMMVTKNTHTIIQHYSDWNKLKRGVAWLLRFMEYLKDRKATSKLPYHSVSELKRAERWILKRVHSEMFCTELHSLIEGKEILGRSRLRSLNPFLKNGLIVVGGRLNNAEAPETYKHPIVLPAEHKVTQLIFRQKHAEQLHCGPQALLAEVRRQYWPLRGRASARSSVLKCVRCVRARPRFTEPIMAPLPKQRVQGTYPFVVTGVDFAGPLIIRSGVRRVVGTKAWIAVFVCFSTRAVHLEAVEDLTSKTFIAALRRFMSRRGRCKTIYSDNGTNFVGAQRELSSYVQSVGGLMAQEGIEWRFNPPSAPHFGGLWESAVKSAKHHLTRMMGEAKLTLSELSTLLCQIEACLNSRPITPMSSDPSDAEALTPAHFLIGRAMSLPPEPCLTNESLSQVRRWKYVQLLMRTFWRRWQSEYLPQFQVRGKWVSRTAPIQVGNVVIIKDEAAPPMRWKLGVVIDVHPGKDGEIRVVTLRTAVGTQMKRPVVKLCILPTETESIVVENKNFQRGENVAAAT